MTEKVMIVEIVLLPVSYFLITYTVLCSFLVHGRKYFAVCLCVSSETFSSCEPNRYAAITLAVKLAVCSVDSRPDN